MTSGSICIDQREIKKINEGLAGIFTLLPRWVSVLVCGIWIRARLNRTIARTCELLPLMDMEEKKALLPDFKELHAVLSLLAGESALLGRIFSPTISRLEDLLDDFSPMADEEFISLVGSLSEAVKARCS